MQLKLSQLAAHLQRPLAPVYVLHGDEPLLQIEAAQSIRDAAAKAGFAERELLVADSGFNWQTLAAANQSLSLFGSRRILDLRIPTAACMMQSLSRDDHAYAETFSQAGGYEAKGGFECLTHVYRPIESQNVD